MTKKILPVVLLSLALCSLTPAQDGAPAPTHEQGNILANPDAPKKPEKEPETAKEFYDAADWSNWNDTKNTAASIALLDKALALDPAFSAAYHFRAILKQRQGKTREAIMDLDDTIRLQPEAHNAYQRRAECKIELKDYRGALADLDMSVSVLASKKLVQYNAFEKRGRLKYILGEYDAAIEDFNNAIRTVNGHGAYFLRAMTQVKKGDNISALRELNELAAYYSTIAKSTREKYPDLYSEMKGYPNSENPLATLKKVEPKVVPDSEATLTLSPAPSYSQAADVGIGIANSGKKEVADFEDKLDPDKWFFPSDTRYFMGYTFGDPNVIYYFIGDLSEKQGDSAAAIKAFTDSIVAESYSGGSSYLRRGKLLLADRQFEPAVRDFSWAIWRIKSVDAYLERGIAILMLGHDKLAQKDFDAYIKLNPEGKAQLASRIAAAKKLRLELKATAPVGK